MEISVRTTDDRTEDHRPHPRDRRQQSALGSAPDRRELLKLGIRVAESTISRYLSKTRHRPGSGRWSAFLRNHAKAIVATDFFVVPTVTFRLLYVFWLLDLDRRRILHFNVTAHPSAEWTAQQVVDAFPSDTAPRWLLRDRDSTYGAFFRRRVANMGITTLLSARRSPWQNPYVERVVGTIRRELLQRVIVINEQHLITLLHEFAACYHDDRTHIRLDKDTPSGREVEGPERGPIVAEPRVGGLHHRYRRAA